MSLNLRQHLLTVPTLPVKRMIGGENAEDGQFPYLVTIHQVGKTDGCAGSILNERFILTAGHCIKRIPAADLSIAVGSTQFSGGKVYQIEKVLDSPFFPWFRSDDIGLIKTALPIEFSEAVKPIAVHQSVVEGGVVAVVSGWGSTSKTNPHGMTEHLQFTHVNTLAVQECVDAFPWSVGQYISNSSLCTFNAGKGMCRGDSGAPLVLNGELIGIASWAIPCADRYPDVYTRISSYLTWIADNMKNN